MDILFIKIGILNFIRPAGHHPGIIIGFINSVLTSSNSKVYIAVIIPEGGKYEQT